MLIHIFFKGIIRRFVFRLRLLTSRMLQSFWHSKRIDFMIVGAQKAGTTSLFDMLNHHKDLVGSIKKEISFFNVDSNFIRGLEAYHSNFELYKSWLRVPFYFEATPQYIVSRKTLLRIKRYNADIKLVVVLREPSSRAFSAWTMYHHHFLTGDNRDLRDGRSFDEAVNAEITSIEADEPYKHPGYVYRGLYYKQLKDAFEIFGRSQVFVTEATELKEFPDQVIRKLTTFLGVPYQKLPAIETHKSRGIDKAEYRAELDELKEYFRPHNEELFELIDCKYDW